MSRTKRNQPHHYLRHQRVKNELTQVADATEQGVHVRAKRKVRRLPDPWDDRPVAAHKEVFHQ